MLGVGFLLFLGALSMPKLNRVVLHRHASFLSQDGLCFYCRSPMWEQDCATYAKTHQLSRKQARLFKCTAEHLVARKVGGNDAPTNIVAACLRCNQWRHRRKKELESLDFLRLIQKKIQKGKLLTLSVLGTNL